MIIDRVSINGTEYNLSGTGGALTEEIVNMLMTVLTNAVYVTDQSANLEALREMLEEITPHIPTNDIDIFGSTILINETAETPTPDAGRGWLII